MCYLEWHRVLVQVWTTLEAGDSCRGEVLISIMGGREGWPVLEHSKPEGTPETVWQKLKQREKRLKRPFQISHEQTDIRLEGAGVQEGDVCAHPQKLLKLAGSGSQAKGRGEAEDRGGKAGKGERVLQGSPGRPQCPQKVTLIF